MIGREASGTVDVLGSVEDGIASGAPDRSDGVA
jgi:hypothetical protein